MKDFTETGRHWLRAILTPADLKNCAAAVEANRPGARLPQSTLSQFGLGSKLNSELRRFLPKAQPVRGVSFNKSATANWSVPWHQDRVIAVEHRENVAGFTNWSLKSGQWHCEPPVSVFSDMLFVRIHIDAATEENGAMEIALGSHRQGLVRSDEAKYIAETCRRELTIAEPGDVLVLHMLTLHRSVAARSDARRRALRIDFAGATLPKPLCWPSNC